MTYENDVLVIPEKYKNMSISELENEKIKLLNELIILERPKKVIKVNNNNNNNIVFKF